MSTSLTSAEGSIRLIADVLGYGSSDGWVTGESDSQSTSRNQHFIRAKRLSESIDGVFFVGDTPIAYFASSTNQSDLEIKALHKRVWCDSLVPILFFISKSEVLVLDSFAVPPSFEEDLTKIVVQRVRIAAGLLSSLTDFRRSKIESGSFWQLPGHHFNFKHRCDSTLLENLRICSSMLSQAGLPDGIVHCLLVRCILIQYMEQRGALVGLGIAERGFNAYLEQGKLYDLFGILAAKFDGDILCPQTGESNSVLPGHIEILRRMFTGERLRDGQLALWPMYDFSVIPVALISSIYESFFRSEDAKESGSFYTPHSIVEMILEEVFPLVCTESPEDLRVLDPSCGSGAFLVEAFKRIVYLWRARGTRRASPEDLRRLLSGCIFGVDINSNAVQVAAFALYLAMLEETTAEEIPNIRFPKLLVSESNSAGNLQVADAFQSDSLVFSRLYDLIVGNPPWQRNPTWVGNAKRFCEDHGYGVAAEKAQPFMWLACERTKPSGAVGMLCPSKFLFNKEGPDRLFRRSLFKKVEVVSLVNLSSLRRDQLFSGAIGPAVAVIFRVNEIGTKRSDGVLYCSPKPSERKAVSIPAIVDTPDIKWIPRQNVEDGDSVWKIFQWGSWRDFDLLNKLRKTGTSLLEFMEQTGLVHGRGLQPFDPTRNKKVGPDTVKLDASLQQMLHLPSDALSRYKVSDNDLICLKTQGFVRLGGDKCVYQSPHVLMAESVSGGRLKAALSNADFTFRDTITGISGGTDDLPLLKALTVYLNSSLAGYFLFFESSSWGVERPRVKKAEVFCLPSSILADSRNVSILACLYDQVVELSGSEYEIVQQGIDSAVMDKFHLGPQDRILIEDFVSSTSRLAESETSDLWRSLVSKKMICEYVECFASVVGRFTKSDLSATIYLTDNPLILVSLAQAKIADGVKFISRTEDMEDALLLIERTLLNRVGRQVYYRRHMKAFTNDGMYIVKPSNARFWSRSAALRDADEALAEALWEGPCQ